MKLSDERLKEIRERCEKATPGPWEFGANYWSALVNDGSHAGWTPPRHIEKGKCALCADPDGKLIREFRDSDGVTQHIHRFPDTGHWHDIFAVSGENITGNYDYEEGGVCSQQSDADFIAHARTDIPDLLEALEEARAELRERERWIPVSEKLPEKNALVMYFVPSNVADLDPQHIVGWWDGSAWEAPYESYPSDDLVTHWRPLPLPPEEGK